MIFYGITFNLKIRAFATQTAIVLNRTYLNEFEVKIFRASFA